MIAVPVWAKLTGSGALQRRLARDADGPGQTQKRGADNRPEFASPPRCVDARSRRRGIARPVGSGPASLDPTYGFRSNGRWVKLAFALQGAGATQGARLSQHRSATRRWTPLSVRADGLEIRQQCQNIRHLLPVEQLCSIDSGQIRAWHAGTRGEAQPAHYR